MKPLVLDVGAVVASPTPATLHTVLGSCVMVCLHDPSARVGGACHFLLPSGVEPGPGHRHGDDALPALVAAVERCGAVRARLQAKVFGALTVLGATAVTPAVSVANALCALSFCAREGIPVIAHRLGGHQALEVLFQTHDGRARVRAVGAPAPRLGRVDEGAV